MAFSSSGGRKFQKLTLPRDCGDLGMVGDQALLDLRVHAPVHAADALHQAHRVPVDVVVDHPGGVLEVQALGQDVGGDQDPDFGAILLGQCRGGHAVVVGREALDHVGPVALGGAVYLGDACRYRPFPAGRLT